MNIQKFIVIWISLLPMLFSSVAISSDANELLAKCMYSEKYLETQQVDDTFQAGFSMGNCTGLLEGVRLTLKYLELSGAFKSTVCWPKGKGNADAVKIVTNHIKQNPEKGKSNDVAMIMHAYANAYPCE